MLRIAISKFPEPTADLRAVILAFAIISEASLSFLGAGVPPDEPSWGNMLRDGQKLR